MTSTAAPKTATLAASVNTNDAAIQSGVRVLKTEAMALIATGLGLASVAGGLGISLQADTPTGPSIVSVAAAGFVLAASIGRMRRA